MPTIVALLGRRDTPTDGLDDYCTFLGEGLKRQGIQLKKIRFDWPQHGWMRSCLGLWRESADWRGRWVLLQFTSLAWSRRGFPFAALAAVAIASARGARTGVVYHEPRALDGPRRIDKVRAGFQNWTIQQLYRRVDKPIFADPLETISWLPRNSSKATFVPIGANLPELAAGNRALERRNGSARTVAIYCLSDSPQRAMELDDISQAIRYVAGNGLRLRIMFLGRGTEEAGEEIEHAFREIPVELLNLGIQSAEQVAGRLVEADAMLCVRGRLYPRRGSALAGISCGLPIVAYAGGSEGTPLWDSGIDLVPYRDVKALGKSLERLLHDDDRWRELHLRSLRAHEKYFSWDAIAANFVRALGLKEA